MDDSKKSPPTTTNNKPTRKARFLKTFLKTFGPDQSAEKDREGAEDVTVLFESEGQIKAATLEKLVERITHESFTSDPTILLDLLVTHKNFTTSEKLLATLISRFKEQVLLNTANAISGTGRPTAATVTSPSVSHRDTITSPGAKLNRVKQASTLAKSPSGRAFAGTISVGSPLFSRLFGAPSAISLDSPDKKKDNKDKDKDKDNKDKDNKDKDNKDKDNKEQEGENKDNDNKETKDGEKKDTDNEAANDVKENKDTENKETTPAEETTTSKTNDNSDDKPTAEPAESANDKPSDNTNDKPTDITNDKPEDNTNNKSEDNINNTPEDNTNNKPEDNTNDKSTDNNDKHNDANGEDKPVDKAIEKVALERHNSSFDGDGADEEEGGETPQIVPSLVHYKIYNVLRSWVEKQWCDFETDADSPEKSTLLTTLTVFVQQTMPAAGMPELSQQLFHLISAKKFGAADSSIAITRCPPPKPLLPLPSAELELSEGATSTPFWLYQPKEIARQLTIMEHAVFAKIQPHEFLNQAWNKKAEAHKAPNISAAIRQFNKISAWASSEILRAENLNLRVEAIIRLIDIAMNCYAMNNFNTMMAMLAAFMSSPIHRLKKTFEGLPAREQSNLEYLTKLMAFSKNYALYREQLKKIEPPCIPYLGIYLTDLTFADEGNSAMTGELINFSKYRRVGGLIREVMHLKSGTYSLTPLEDVQKYIKKYEVMNEERAYAVSLQIEPRATKDGRPEEDEGTQINVSGQSNIASNFEIEAWDTPSSIVTSFKDDANPHLVLNLAVDPVPLMILLPGSAAPLLVRVPPTCTGQLAMKRFAEFFNDISEAHTLVVMPNRATPSGYIVEDSAILKNYAASLDVSPPDYVLGVYVDPQLIRVVYYGGTMSEPTVMLLDYGTPISSIISTFQAVFKVSEDFTFFKYSLETHQVQWISMNRSLSENQFSLKDHVLFLYSIPLLFNRKPVSDCIKNGFLMKRSRKANTILKMTPIKRRWFLLIDRFLLYYKSKNDTRPVSVVSMDHHVPRMGHRKGGLCLFIERTCEAFPRPSSQAIYYVLTSEDELDLRSWFRTMRKNCGLLGDEPIFGVDMEEVASRPSSKNRIPLIISKTISFLYNSALTLNGVFKQAGSAAIVEQLKKQFDMGLNVEFSHSTDPFAVASLLVLYLEELPGPLATYDLFTQFIACGATLATTNELAANKLRSLISMLPLSNICVLNYLLAFLAQFASENPLGKQGVIEIFTRLVLRPHPDFMVEPGTETPENVFEKMLSLHDLVFHGLIESLTKQQVVTQAPKVPEIEDVLANELSVAIQALVSEKKLVFNPVSRSDLKFNIVGGPRYQKLSPQASPGDAPNAPFSSDSSLSSSPSSPGSLSSSGSYDTLPPLPRVPSQPTVSVEHHQSLLHRSVSQPVISILSGASSRHSPPYFAKQPSPGSSSKPKAETVRLPGLGRSQDQLTQAVAQKEAKLAQKKAQKEAQKDQKKAQKEQRRTQAVTGNTPPQQEQKQTPPETTTTPAQVTSPTSPTSPQTKQCTTVFGTHRLTYSVSAPVPGPSIQNAAPARAHNNTSPAAVEVKPPGEAQGDNAQGDVAKGDDAQGDVAKGDNAQAADACAKPCEPDATKPEVSVEGGVVGDGRMEGGIPEVLARHATAELPRVDSPAQSRRHAKAYTFFTTAAPRPAPLPGEQLVNCVYCGKEQRATDRFCASCGHKRT